MNYTLTEQQQLIADAATRLFADECPLTLIRALADAKSPEAARAAVAPLWQAMADSGWLGICASAQVGGSELGLLDALPLLIAAGRHAAPYPLAEQILAAAWLAPVQPALAADVIAGREQVALADANVISAQATPGGWTLDATLDAVAWAAVGQARWLILPVTLATPAVPPMPQLVLIDLALPSVQRRQRRTVDLTHPMTTLTLTGHALRQSDVIGHWDAPKQRQRALMAAAELQGAAQTCLDMAVAYMNERQQFGGPIGRFQALKHLAATAALAIESMRVANEVAAWCHDADEPDADAAVHTAKQYANQHARTTAEDTLQCHGGMGYAWDYGLHLFLRRILRLAATGGTTYDHREALISGLIQEHASRHSLTV